MVTKVNLVYLSPKFAKGKQQQRAEYVSKSKRKKSMKIISFYITLTKCNKPFIAVKLKNEL